MNTKLQNAVLKQIGITKKEFVNNVSDYQNAQNGISGFTYYSDTHKFALKNQSLINELLQECAEEQGIEVLEMVLSFGIFRNGADKDEKNDIYKFLGGNKKESAYSSNSVLNVMAWFVVEHLAYLLEE
jgi:hypothetical protein